MLCGWLNGRFEIYFALYFFVKQFIFPLLIEYIRAVKYGLAILPDGVNLETTPLRIRPTVDISLHNSCIADNASLAALNIQHEVDVELTKIYLAEYLPSLLVIFFFGVRTDNTGRRRFLLAVPLLGLAAFWLGFVIDYYIHPGTLSYVYAGAITSGMTGGDGAVRIAMTAFVSDTSPVERRTQRLVVMEILRQVAAATASLSVATWFNKKGFEPCMWIGFAFTIMLLKFVTHLMNESNPLDREFRAGDFVSFLEACTYRNLRTVANRVYVMVLVAYSCFAFVEGGFFFVVLAVAEREPLCVTPLVGWHYLGGMQAVSVTGLLLVTMFTYFLDDYKIGLIGISSALAGGILMGFSNHSWELLLVAALLLFHAVPYPVLLSIASKHTVPQKRGIAFAFISLGETTAVFLAFVVYPPLTEMSFGFVNAPVFFVGALFLLVPFIIFGMFAMMAPSNAIGVLGVRELSDDGSKSALKDDLDQDFPSDTS